MPLVRELVLGRLRMPWVIAGLILVIAFVSIAGAVGARNDDGITQWILLSVPDVWGGQLWRLVTWSLCERNPLSLIFACLTLYWFGNDLARRWGERRLLGFFVGVAAAAAAVTALVGLVWFDVQFVPYAGSWAVLDALIISWGLLHAGAEIRLYGVIRMTGRTLVWLTVGLTVLFALFNGLALYVPHFAAELLVLAWLGPLRRLPAEIRRKRQAALKDKASKFDLHDWIEKDRRR